MTRNSSGRRGGTLPTDDEVAEILKRTSWSVQARGVPFWADCARCRSSFRSLVQTLRVVGLVSRDPCPKCGSHLVRRARPEIDHGTR